VFVKISVRLTRLQQLYKPMSEKLSAKPVAARLFQDDVLSLAELEKVQCSHTPTEAAEHLIRQLLSKRSDHSYRCFLTALGATDQGHIVLWLNNDGRVLYAVGYCHVFCEIVY
jgi:Caspase recruitment domain